MRKATYLIGCSSVLKLCFVSLGKAHELVPYSPISHTPAVSSGKSEFRVQFCVPITTWQPSYCGKLQVPRKWPREPTYNLVWGTLDIWTESECCGISLGETKSTPGNVQQNHRTFSEIRSTFQKTRWRCRLVGDVSYQREQVASLQLTAASLFAQCVSTSPHIIPALLMNISFQSICAALGKCK